MRALLIPIVSFIIISLVSCNSQKTNTFWVNSYKRDCDAGVGKMQCLLISKNDTLENAKWTYFYSTIEGFEFKPGYFQKIEVKETILDKKEVPADASTIEYSLIKILEEVKDMSLKLNDIWVPTKINRVEITSKEQLPMLEIHISKMQILGTDGCNNFNGGINELTATKISFGPIASTRKMCQNMEVSDSFNIALSKTTHYKNQGLNLYFFDDSGNETIAFKKID